MAAVDLAVRRVLEGKVRLGLFEQPYVDADRAGEAYQTPDQRALARRAAAASTILLANDGVLPLSPDLTSIAVVGPGADDERLLQGDYHYPAHVEIVYEAAAEASGDGGGLLPEAGGAFAPGPYFTPHTTPLAGIRDRAPAGCRVEHALGCDVSGEDRSGIDAAVALAAASDVAVVVVAGRSGLRPACTVGEARDAVDLDLTGVQPALVAAVAATGTPTVVVVLSGRVHTLAGVAGSAAALLQVWPPGEEGGAGLADVLFGDVNPAGRLPVTLPRHVGQVPIHHGHRAGGDRSQFYGDYTDSPTSPLYAFGHGLSYTTFAYGDLDVTSSTTAAPVVVSVAVTNTGARDGDEVVQLYGRDEVASVARPDSMLLGFARVPLAAGETRHVTFAVDPSRLAFYDADLRFVVEPGALTLHVGASSADLRSSARVVLDGEVVEHRQRDVVATAVDID
jgi:beta-glucosidase